jgi:hypothetical protein
MVHVSSLESWSHFVWYPDTEFCVRYSSVRKINHTKLTHHGPKAKCHVGCYCNLSGIYRWCRHSRDWHLQMVHRRSWDCTAFTDGAQTFMRLSGIYRWCTDIHETVEHLQMVHRHSWDCIAFTDGAQTFMRLAFTNGAQTFMKLYSFYRWCADIHETGIYRWCTDIHETVWHLQMVHRHSWDCLVFTDGA